MLLLHDVISKVSNWMSCNLLSLNQSKTEFLLIGLPQQLSKLSNPILAMPSNVSITPPSTARNLGVIFDSTLSMSDHILPYLYLVSVIFVILIRSTLDLTTAKTIATSLIIILVLTTATHFFLIFLQLNSIVFNLYFMLLLVRLLKLKNFFISLLY